jgi:hypothetical protein
VCRAASIAGASRHQGQAEGENDITVLMAAQAARYPSFGPGGRFLMTCSASSMSKPRLLEMIDHPGS